MGGFNMKDNLETSRQNGKVAIYGMSFVTVIAALYYFTQSRYHVKGTHGSSTFDAKPPTD